MIWEVKNYGTKTPGRYISGTFGLSMERPEPGGKGLVASEKGRFKKENQKNGMKYKSCYARS